MMGSTMDASVRITPTWQRVSNATNDDLTVVEVDRLGRIWVGGASGNLYRSDDTARTFQHVATAPQTGIAGVWCDGQHRIVVCAGGEIVASDDDGATWNATSCRGKYNDNLAERGGVLVATNIRGRVLISLDGGAHWKSRDADSKRYLYSIASNEAGTLCAGSDEAILLSHDAGVTWRAVKLSHRQYMRGAYVLASGEMVLVGDEGKVHLGNSAGKIVAAHLEKKLCLYAVTGVETALVAVGHKDYAIAIRYSVDRGATWSEDHVDDPGATRQLSAVCRLADGSFVAVGDHGGIWVRR